MTEGIGKDYKEIDGRKGTEGRDEYARKEGRRWRDTGRRTMLERMTKE